MDRNPLRRRSDRIETFVILLLIAAYALAAPVAAWHAGQDAYRDGLRTEHVEQATRTKTTAVLLADAETSPPTADVPPAPVPVQARWTAPDGKRITGLISVSSDTRKGARTSIWVDRAGQLAGPPQPHQETISNSVTRAGLTVIPLALVLIVGYASLRRALNQRRLAEWQTAWRRVEPLWSGRRRGRREDGPTA